MSVIVGSIPKHCILRMHGSSRGWKTLQKIAVDAAEMRRENKLFSTYWKYVRRYAKGMKDILMPAAYVANMVIFKTLTLTV